MEKGPMGKRFILRKEEVLCVFDKLTTQRKVGNKKPHLALRVPKHNRTVHFNKLRPTNSNRVLLNTSVS